MADMNNPVIFNAGRLGAIETDTVANIMAGAQLGVGPHLPFIDAATPLVMNPIVPIVTHSPTMFAALKDYDDALKALVERHPKSIEGIDFGYTMEGQPTPAGHDGQELHMPTATKRTQVTPTFVWQELQGNLVWNFIKNWIIMTKDPDTQASGLAALNVPAAAGTASSVVMPQLFSSFAMDVLFIQFDPTFRPENIIDGYFITNMWPQETGLAGFKRQVGVSEMPDRTIPFHGVVQHNKNTKHIARQIAEILQLHKIDYTLAAPVAQSIESRLADKGLRKEISQIATDFKAYTTAGTPTGGAAGPTII